jgi:hypothetical protein
MGRPGLRHFGLLGAALIAAAGGYYVWWHKTAEQAQETLAQWVEARRLEGIDLQLGDVSKEGFPFAFRLAAHAPKAQITRPEGAWIWSGPERLGITVSLLQPGQIVLAAPGRHALSDPKGRQTIIEAAMLSATLVANGPELNGVGIEIEKGSAGAPGANEPLRLEKLALSLEKRHPAKPLDLKEPTLIVELRAQGIDLPPETEPPLGPRIEGAELRALFYAPMPADLSESSARGWNEAGGTLEIERLQIAWPPLEMKGEGTLALDRDLQPLGSFTANLKGAFETVDVLAKRKLVDAGDALVAKLALAVLAKTSPDPPSGVIRLPLTLQNRAVTLGPARLLKLKEIHWRADAARP